MSALSGGCNACGEALTEPYVECAECDATLCPGCFAAGREPRRHRNDHRYAFRRNDFPLFDNCNWTAREETRLLAALAAHGYGNWEEIAKAVHTRTKLECQEHYKKFYIEKVQHKELDLLPETDQSMFPKIVVPYLYNMEFNRDPPRNNQSDLHMAGYNAYRSEFELSYDHNAENIFSIENTYSDDDDEDEDLMDALKLSLANALNNRLRERKRRYKIIQTHGLIMINKLFSWVQAMDKVLPRQQSERLLPFMQFMTGMQFDTFLESMALGAELFQKLVRLREYRKLGIRTLHGARVYNDLKGEHESMLSMQRATTNLMAEKYNNQCPGEVYYNQTRPRDRLKHRKKWTMPLDIMDLPSFHLLSESEKSVCSSLRLVPQHYLEIKELLMAENRKMGTLKLLDARKIVKIDVNKTRKIYDFFIAEGYINCPKNCTSQSANKPTESLT